MRETARPRDSRDLSWPWPWQGTVELPPGGINHAYKPVVRTKKDGRAGIGFAKVSGYADWAEAQVWLLRQQGVPRLAAGTPVSIVLRQRLRNARADVDGLVKAVLDVLAQALSPADGPPWDDRDCHLLVLSKVVDKRHPGVTVTVLPYEEQAPERALGILMSLATWDKEGLP